MRQGQKNCKPAGDCCVVSGGLDAQGHLQLTMAGGQTVDVGAVTPSYADAAACAVPAKLLGADGLRYPFAELRAARTVYGVSPLVINPTNGVATLAAGFSEGTPITTLKLTNPSACWPMTVEVKILHLIYAAYSNVAAQATKTQSFGFYSIINFDNGSGTLQLLPLNANTMGNSQMVSHVVPPEVGSTGPVGVETAETGVAYVTVPAGGSVTLRAQSQLTVVDAGTNVLAWTVTQLAALGIVG